MSYGLKLKITLVGIRFMGMWIVMSRATISILYSCVDSALHEPCRWCACTSSYLACLSSKERSLHFSHQFVTPRSNSLFMLFGLAMYAQVEATPKKEVETTA